MDRQKIFWVVLSVSVFVVVVLVVGVLLLRQKPVAAAVSAAPGTVSPLSDPGTQIYEYAQSAGEGTETMHFVIGDTGEPAVAGSVPPAEGSEPAAAAPIREEPPAAATAAPAAPVATAQKKPVVKPAAARPAPPTGIRAGTEYWIQTGSYKSQTRAEELATMLEGKGLAGRVFSHASGADTYFRVRVGPYRNKGEAEKFLSTVRQIQGLESSYISMVAGGGKVN